MAHRNLRYPILSIPFRTHKGITPSIYRISTLTTQKINVNNNDPNGTRMAVLPECDVELPAADAVEVAPGMPVLVAECEVSETMKGLLDTVWSPMRKFMTACCAGSKVATTVNSPLLVGSSVTSVTRGDVQLGARFSVC